MIRMSRKIVIFIHTSFWTLYILLGVLINVAVHHDLKITSTLYVKDLTDPFTWVGYGRTILTCYISLWVFNALFSRRQYIAAVLAIIVLVFFDIILRYLLEQVFMGPVFGLWQYHAGITKTEYLIDNVFYSTLGIFICFFLKIINDYFINERIREEKNSMELQFLKSQVNPHFLFNSFNNLYGLSLTEPQKTPDAILKLAELTRYMIYESNEEKVLLSKEIGYLRNLIELQKLRYEEMVCLEFTVKYQEEGKLIAPLLLISFVENAFKHGEVHDPSHPIVIELTLKNGALCFYVTNKINHRNKDHTGGIGLKNVRRRLDLLYPGHYRLLVQDDGNMYTTALEMTLN